MLKKTALFLNGAFPYQRWSDSCNSPACNLHLEETRFRAKYIATPRRLVKPALQNIAFKRRLIAKRATLFCCLEGAGSREGEGWERFSRFPFWQQLMCGHTHWQDFCLFWFLSDVAFNSLCTVQNRFLTVLCLKIFNARWKIWQSFTPSLTVHR